jgi:hypothetical protein
MLPCSHAGSHTATHATSRTRASPTATTATTAAACGIRGRCHCHGSRGNYNQQFVQVFHDVAPIGWISSPTAPHATTTAASGTCTTTTSSECAATSESGIAARSHAPLASFIAGAVGMAFRAHFLLPLFLLKVSFRRVLRLGNDNTAWFRKDIARQGKVERTPHLVAVRLGRGLSPCRRGND